MLSLARAARVIVVTIAFGREIIPHAVRRHRMRKPLIAVVVLSVLATIGIAAPAYGAPPGDPAFLGTADGFAVLGGSTVTNTGSSVITGEVGVAPGSAVVGFPPGTVSGGTIHGGDGIATAAQVEVTTAYNIIGGLSLGTDLTGHNLGGLTLIPGVYDFATSAQLTGTLVLDAQGVAGAVFVFRVGSTLTTASSSSVQLINGAQSCNVYWNVGSSATLGTTTSFVGTILAQASVTANTGAGAEGRPLARNGAVTLDTNVVTRPTCATAPPPPGPGAELAPTGFETGATGALGVLLLATGVLVMTARVRRKAA